MRIVGIRFRSLGKVYSFDALDFEMRAGDGVIVETNRGIEYGWVVYPPREALESESEYPLREVLRLSTPEDDAQQRQNREQEKQAYRLCLEKIREHGLQMKLIAAEYTFNNKIMFYFTADGRVDFRLLVKDLAAVFKTRIELRQVGVRDETKFLGGIGICGRPLCCNSYLTDFVPVSIRMAKDQNLSLNQTKISGVCGRLMCCLKYEQDTYEYLNKTMPNMGEMVILPDGMQGKVISMDVLRQSVKVSYEVNDEIEVSEYYVEELSYRGSKARAFPKPAQEPLEGEAGEQEPLLEEAGVVRSFHRQRDLRSPSRKPLRTPRGEQKERTVRGEKKAVSQKEARGEGEQKPSGKGGKNPRQGKAERVDRGGKEAAFKGKEAPKKNGKKKFPPRGGASAQGEGPKKKDREKDYRDRDGKKKRSEKPRRPEGELRRMEGPKKGENRPTHRREKNAPDSARDE